MPIILMLGFISLNPTYRAAVTAVGQQFSAPKKIKHKSDAIHLCQMNQDMSCRLGVIRVIFLLHLLCLLGSWSGQV